MENMRMDISFDHNIKYRTSIIFEWRTFKSFYENVGCACFFKKCINTFFT